MSRNRDRNLADRIEVRQSGWLNRCISSLVALIYQLDWIDLAWLPTKLRIKIDRWSLPQHHRDDRLNWTDIPAIVYRHFAKGKLHKRCQIIDG